MSGHSHWAGIKNKKALIDHRRGKVWSKRSKAIIVAAKMGGGDPGTNLRLRYAIDDAKKVSMPKDNITRAIKKGTGELAGGNLEEISYEGYGVGGVAVMCDILTDNRNRTAPEVRKIFEKAGGKLGASGCVAWMFETKGLFLVSAAAVDEDQLMEIALEAGADDIEASGENFAITCDPSVYSQVGAALKAANIEPDVSELSRVPSTTVDLDAANVRQVLRMMEQLDDHDDVQSVSANFNIPDDVMAEIGEEA